MLEIFRISPYNVSHIHHSYYQMNRIQSIRGMNDILPSESYQWQYLENSIKEILNNYGVQEIRLPIVEKSELFHRGVGDGTDIVEKETYDFEDRSQEKLTLRPEGTAGCVRAMIQHGLIKNQTQRVWYIGPMYRYERPQKGRYRQFYQLGIEYFGINGSVIEAELITLTWRLWQKLGISSSVMLEINNLGDQQARADYAKALVAHFSPIKEQLDDDSQRRLIKNPLRILDSKNEQTQKLLLDAPKIDDYLDNTSQDNFEQLCDFLSAQNIPYKINKHLVRGIDYYTHTVFEWKTNLLGAQDTICAGGRYDALTEQLGGSNTPALGLAMGLERLLLLLESTNRIPAQEEHSDICIISSGEKAVWKGLHIAEAIRTELSNLKIYVNPVQLGFKSQFKRADKLNAKIAIVIGDEEIQNEKYGVKFLKEYIDQQTLTLTEIIEHLKNYFA